MQALRHSPLGALAALMLPATSAGADQPAERPGLLQGCEQLKAGTESEPATCARCKPGYQLSGAGTCMRLGDYGSTRGSILPHLPPVRR